MKINPLFESICLSDGLFTALFLIKQYLILLRISEGSLLYISNTSLT